MAVNYTLKCIVAVKNDVYGWSNEVGTIITSHITISIMSVYPRNVINNNQL